VLYLMLATSHFRSCMPLRPLAGEVTRRSGAVHAHHGGYLSVVYQSCHRAGTSLRVTCCWSSSTTATDGTMGTSEAFLSAFFCFCAFMSVVAVVFYCWLKHTSRHDTEVMLDCARKAGGERAMYVIREQLKLDGEPGTSRVHARQDIHTSS